MIYFTQMIRNNNKHQRQRCLQVAQKDVCLFFCCSSFPVSLSPPSFVINNPARQQRNRALIPNTIISAALSAVKSVATRPVFYGCCFKYVRSKAKNVMWFTCCQPRHQPGAATVSLKRSPFVRATCMPLPLPPLPSSWILFSSLCACLCLIHLLHHSCLLLMTARSWYPCVQQMCECESPSLGWQGTCNAKASSYFFFAFYDLRQ